MTSQAMKRPKQNNVFRFSLDDWLSPDASGLRALGTQGVLGTSPLALGVISDDVDLA